MESFDVQVISEDRVTIPFDIREKLGIKEAIVFVLRD